MDNQDKIKLEALFDRFLHDGLERISFGNPTDRKQVQKVRCRPVFLRGEVLFQVEEFRGKQVFHQNLSKAEGKAYLTGLLDHSFRQCELTADGEWAQVLVGKKKTITIKQKKTGKRNAVKIRAEEESMQESEQKTGSSEEKRQRLMHNRAKHYVLEEGTPVPFLVDLGVMTKEGKVIRAKYDKFRQINRFLEFIEDILPQLSKDRENVIIDFGCGKSYLTFAMYYYLKEQKAYPIRVIGLDLKEDVIKHCSELGRKYGFEHLTFCCGDIASYEWEKKADMVVTLHACDTATDYALAKAVNWGAKVILSVPCCQHEWNRQMKNKVMEPVLQYGLLKERMAALLTDGVRAEVLEQMGYRTQILEFIDMEHTPKNILIRAVYQGQNPKQNKRNAEKLKELLQFWTVNPTLVKLLLPKLSEAAEPLNF